MKQERKKKYVKLFNWKCKQANNEVGNKTATSNSMQVRV